VINKSGCPRSRDVRDLGFLKFVFELADFLMLTIRSWYFFAVHNFKYPRSRKSRDLGHPEVVVSDQLSENERPHPSKTGLDGALSCFLVVALAKSQQLIAKSGL
jgi:hypothetical protein